MRDRPPASPSFGLAALLTTLVALGPLSTDLYLPSLPTLVEVFATDAARVQLTLSVFLAGFAVAQLAYGALSDRYGRRPAYSLYSMVTAGALAALAFRWQWLSAHPELFWLTMLTLGLGSGCTATSR